MDIKNIQELIDRINKTIPDKLRVYISEEEGQEVLYVDREGYPEKAYDVTYGSGIGCKLVSDDYEDRYKVLIERHGIHTGGFR